MKYLEVGQVLSWNTHGVDEYILTHTQNCLACLPTLLRTSFTFLLRDELMFMGWKVNRTKKCNGKQILSSKICCTSNVSIKNYPLCWPDPIKQFPVLLIQNTEKSLIPKVLKIISSKNTYFTGERF
jgi:hypothetical protein